MSGGSEDSDGILFVNGKPREKTLNYRIHRLCERFQSWIPQPKDFFALDEQTQSLLVAYECVRESEEALRIG